MKRFFTNWLFLIVACVGMAFFPSPETSEKSPSQGPRHQVGATLRLVETISGDIRPKSIGHSGTGRFFAQNMMYRHSITVYDRNFRLIKTISDRVNFDQFHVEGRRGSAQGSPVEVAFSPDGSRAWVSNYKMYGPGFENPGQDNCEQSAHFDHSFLYEINTQSLEIVRIIEVGAVPKYLTCSPDGAYLLVANWCSGDVSVVDIAQGKEVRRLPVGRYPRGIEIDSKSRNAYVGLMGEDRLAVINLSEFTLSWIDNVGKTPRHLCLDPSDRFLYLSLSRLGEVAKVDLVRREVVSKVKVGREARSMSFSSDHQFVYVVDYEEAHLIKVRCEDLRVVERISTGLKPIGLTLDPQTGNIWVACYTGMIQVFADQDFSAALAGGTTPAPGTTATRTTPYRPGAASPSEEPYRYLYGQPSSQISGLGNTAGHSPTSAPPGGQRPPLSGQDQQSAFDLATVSPQPRQRSAGPRELRYHVIVGSFQDEKPASAYLKELSSRNISATILHTDPVYRISVEAFSTQEEAKSALPRIKATIHPDAWILSY